MKLPINLSTSKKGKKNNFPWKFLQYYDQLSLIPTQVLVKMFVVKNKS